MVEALAGYQIGIHSVNKTRVKQWLPSTLACKTVEQYHCRLLAVHKPCLPQAEPN